jgi:arabinose-5-phosphate isomerase
VFEKEVSYICYMFATQEVLVQALETIELQAASVKELMRYINDEFAEAVRILHEAKGRVVITGIGKSAIIAQKIVATMNSTGTPALFMHAADAIHGDLGMVQQEDVVMIISKSGESPEIKVLIPLIKNFGNPVVALCGKADSYLATNADHFVNCSVEKEACPNNLAPTTSTTAQMVMGDAMAICLLNLKGFTTEDFARFHPGGALGKRLYLRVSDLSNMNHKPSVKPEATVREIIYEISSKRLGAAVVIDEEQNIKGIITDGDLRRMLEKHDDTNGLTAIDICSLNPKTIEGDELAMKAMELMRANNISQLVVTNNGKYDGILHLHDLVKEGLL